MSRVEGGAANATHERDAVGLRGERARAAGETARRVSTPRVVKTVFQLGSVRFTFYYWMTCAIGLYGAGQATVPWLAFTFGFWLACCLATELLNRWADRVEDRINRPERVAMATVVGFARLRVLAIGLYVVMALWAAVWIALAPSLILASLLLFDLFVSYHYSCGLRLKVRPRLAMVVLAVPVTAPLLTGWATGGDPSSVLQHGLPLAAVLGLFFAGLVGIKDITDLAGDRAVGYSSPWVALLTGRRPWPLVLGTTSAFVLLLALVLGGVLPARLTVLVALLPLSAAVLLAAARARSGPEREAAREAMYHYSAVVIGLTLLLYTSGRGVVVTIFGLVGWFGASRFLHWARLLTWSNAKTWLALLGGRTAWSTR